MHRDLDRGCRFGTCSLDADRITAGDCLSRVSPAEVMRLLRDVDRERRFCTSSLDTDRFNACECLPRASSAELPRLHCDVDRECRFCLPSRFAMVCRSREGAQREGDHSFSGEGGFAFEAERFLEDARLCEPERTSLEAQDA